MDNIIDEDDTTRSDRAGWNDPVCRLLGEAGDGVYLEDRAKAEEEGRD